jgi:hypothetical protein
MSSFMAFETRWISLAERSRSSFAFVPISYVHVRIFLLPVMPTRAVSGKSKSMRVGFHTGTRRLRVVVEGILL